MSDLLRATNFFELAFATYGAMYLIREALVWRHAADVIRRRKTVREFFAELWDCEICLSFQITLIPVIIYTHHLLITPVRWLAVNGVVIALMGYIPIERRPPKEVA